MRKILNGLLLLSLLLVINVKADMGPPVLPTFKFEVINPNGTTCYETLDDGNIKAIETLKYNSVHYGSEVGYCFSGEGAKYSTDYYCLETDEGQCLIKKGDIAVAKDKFEPVEEDKDPKEELPKEIKALEEIKIYDGPSKNFYKEIGTVPKDTSLKPEFKLRDFWYYIEYNGIKGYISSEDNAIVYKMNPIIGVTYYEMDIYDKGEITWKNNDDRKVIGTIPVNTELPIEWATDYHRNYYVTYNGVSGFVDSHYTFGDKCDGTKIEVKKSVDVYDFVGLSDEYKKHTKVGSLDANQEYDVKYCAGRQGWVAYYITSMNGWIDEDHDDPYIIEKDPDGKVYDHTREAIWLEKIEIKGHPFDFKYDQTSYDIELNDGETNLEFVVTPEEVKVEVTGNEDLKDGSVVTLKITDDDGTEIYTFNIKTKKIVNDVEPPKPVKPEPKKETRKLSYEELIMICVGAGIIIAVTILIIIKLVNKKKTNALPPVQNQDDNESKKE